MADAASGLFVVAHRRAGTASSSEGSYRPGEAEVAAHRRIVNRFGAALARCAGRLHFEEDGLR
jgi:hypothetical protein